MSHWAREAGDDPAGQWSRALLFSALAACCLINAGCEDPQESETMSRNYKGEVTDGAIPVEVLTLRPCAVDDTNLAPGVIEPEEEVTLSAEIAGRILSMPLEVGDSVKKGQLLVTLDDSSLQAQVRRIEAQISRTETLMEKAKRDREREEKLFNANAGAGRSLDDARSQVQMHEDEIRAQRAELDSIRVDLRKFRIHSPVDGAVAEKHSAEGEYANPGTRFCKLVTTDRVEFVFSIPEADVTKVSAGDPVEISIDVLPEASFTGQIRSIAPAGNLETRTFRVWAILENPEPHPLLAGMSGKALVHRGRHENVLVVPEEVLLRGEDGSPTMMVVEDGKARRVAVREVAAMGSRSLIDAAGHPAELQCILYGQHAVKDGGAVRVRKTHESPPEKSFH